jgi:hypothetical protein
MKPNGVRAVRPVTACACAVLLLAGAVVEAEFVDLRESAGVDFLHFSDGGPEKLLPETMGGGLAIFDSDADGDIDLYFVNGAPLTAGSTATVPVNALYLNESRGDDWSFVEVPGARGADDDGYGMGSCVGDYDGDGLLDLYVTNVGPNRLYHATDAGYTDATAAAGVGSERWSTACAFADLDGDGRQDLYVVNYLRDTLLDPVRCEREGHRFYCHPREFAAESDVLYRNEGGGRFRDASRSMGVHDAIRGKGLGLAIFDYDADGDLDIYVANDTEANFLYRFGDGIFEEIGEQAGCAYNEDARAEAGMGVAAADVDGDGDVDLYVGNFELETNTLYVNEGDGLFTDATTAAGLGILSRRWLTFATLFFDYDNDGDEDLFTANGHLQNDLTLHDGRVGSDEPDQLLRNEGGRFTDVSATAGDYFRQAMTSRAAAAADLDGDGDLDLVVTHLAQFPALLRNTDMAPGNRLRVDVGHGRAGTTAEVFAGDTAMSKQLVGGTSYLSQGDGTLWFGLGDVAAVDSVRVIDPDGQATVYRDIAINTTLRHRAGPR